LDRVIIRHALNRIRKLNIQWNEDERAEYYGIDQVREYELDDNKIDITIYK